MTHLHSPFPTASTARLRVIALALSVAVCCSALSACVTDPYTGERRISKTALGSLFGAGAGAGVSAGIAALAGKDVAKAALIGAGVGALTGGAVGLYMDSQDAKLRKFLEGTGVSVTRVGNEIILNMPGNVTFESDSDVIQPSFDEVLHAVALVLQEYDKTIIEVMGHTDSTGSDAHNLDLSKRRAASVGSHLIREGVNPVRVLTEGFGEQYPIADNAAAGGRQSNRRVELRLSPLVADG